MHRYNSQRAVEEDDDDERFGKSILVHELTSFFLGC